MEDYIAMNAQGILIFCATLFIILLVIVFNAIARKEKELYNAATAEKQEEEKPKSESSYDDLKKLKELLDMGAITQEEFDRKKKELLNL